MRDLYAIGKAAALTCGALFLVTATGGSAFAQGTGSRRTPSERRVEQFNRQGEQYERDQLERDHKGASDKPGDRKRAQEVAAQVRKDFEDLQAGYNRIVIAMSSPKGFDYDSVSDSVADVHRCAARLKSNLALPRPKGDEEHKARGEAAPEQVEAALLALRKHVYSFVTNPLFEAPAVLDVEQAGKASRDLDRIIEISDGIRKGGDKLKRPQAKP